MTAPADTAARQAAIDDAQQLIRTADTKASLLLALTGALLAVSASAARDLPDGALVRVVGGLALAVLAAAGVLLLATVRPRRPGDLTAAYLLAAAADPAQQADRLEALAAIIRAKFRLIARAVDCLLAGGVLLAATAITAAV